MKSAIKFPLLVLLCLLCSETVLNRQAIAGKNSIVTPDASGQGLGDTFSNFDSSPRSEYSCTNNGVANSLRNIQRSESVPSVGGQELSISPSQLDSIQSLVSNDRPTASSLSSLAQQIENETGLNVEVSRADLSSSALRSATNSANEMILALEGNQLAAAANSPTLMSLLELLRGGNTAPAALDSLAGQCEVGLLKVSLVEEAPPIEIPTEPAEPLPPLRTPDPIPEPEPEPVPTFQEPVRGLW